MSIISWIFKKKLQKSINENQELKDALQSADNDLNKFKKYINNLKKNGEYVPSFIDKYFKEK